MDNTRIAVLADKARNLKRLAATEGWKALEAHVRLEHDRRALSLGKRILSGETLSVEEQSREYGAAAEAKRLVKLPSQTEAKLEEQLRKAEAREVDDA